MTSPCDCTKSPLLLSADCIGQCLGEGALQAADPVAVQALQMAQKDISKAVLLANVYITLVALLAILFQYAPLFSGDVERLTVAMALASQISPETAVQFQPYTLAALILFLAASWYYKFRRA